MRLALTAFVLVRLAGRMEAVRCSGPSLEVSARFLPRDSLCVPPWVWSLNLLFAHSNLLYTSLFLSQFSASLCFFPEALALSQPPPVYSMFSSILPFSFARLHTFVLASRLGESSPGVGCFVHFYIYIYETESVSHIWETKSRPVVSDSMQPHGL